ncbi:MAG: alpha/beta hydrolase [Pseudomonadota bacterium]
MTGSTPSLSIVRRLLPDFGTTYGPAGDGPYPAILVLHGSEGGLSGWSHRNAVLLAAHGFVAYSHPYSKGGNAWNAGSITDVPLDRTVEALVARRAAPFCTGQGGRYGVSRGAEHALLVASLMARDGLDGLPEAIAAHSPADVVCGAFDARRWRDRGDPGWQVWDPADRSWTWRGSSDDLTPTTPIEIERYEGPLFLSHGTADTTWDVSMTKRLEERLKANGRSPEVHYYEGQNHIGDSDGENDHHERLLAFFQRHLTGD